MVKMKHPYAHYLKQYMEFLSGHYAEITLLVRERRLNQFKKIVYEMNKERKVSTVSPRHLTSKDIAQMIGYRKKNDVSSETIQDDISFLNGFLKFCGNDAVEKFKEEYPRFVPKTYRKRKDCFSEEQFRRILEYADKVHSSGPYRMRAYAVVVFCMCGGLRTLEIQNAKVRNLDRTDKLDKLWLDIVKGGDTYGQSRWAPLLPQSREFIDRYLEMRSRYLMEHGIVSDLLIPPFTEDVGVMSDKNIRKLKDYVCEDVGFRFDLRILRRTYAQYLVDADVTLDVVQVALGHSNPNTTYRNYAGVRPERVTSRIFEKIGKKEVV